MFGIIFVATIIGSIVGFKIARDNSYEKAWKEFSRKYGIK